MDVRDLAVKLNNRAKEIAVEAMDEEGFGALLLSAKAGALQETSIVILQWFTEQQQKA